MAYETGEPVAQGQAIGRAVTLGAISTAVAVTFFIVSRAPALVAWGWLLLILTCGQLYIGLNWARWVVGVVLVIMGCGWSYVLATSGPVPLRLDSIAFILLTLASLSAGLALLVMKQVKIFMEAQRAHQSNLSRRISQTLWVITAIVFALLLAADFMRNSDLFLALF
jgi:hypothetical protein